jgi:hypothetical protein
MSGGGGSGSDGGGGRDMQVSGAEAAYSNEAGISTHADTRTSSSSYSGGRDGPQDRGGVHNTGLQKGPDTSTVGIAAPSYSNSEIEKGYSDTGEKLSNVGGTYMTKAEMYSTGVVEKDPTTGEDVQGRYRVNPNSGEFERTDMSFGEHWANRPDSIKYSPTLSLLYAGGKNIGDFASKKGFQGYNEAGLKTGNFFNGNTSREDGNNNTGGGGDGERARMNTIAPHAPYIVSGTTKPTNSPAQKWYQSLGASSTNPSGFNLATEYASAKAKVAKTLGTSTPVGQLAVNDTPYFNFLKKNNLDKGIL